MSVKSAVKSYSVVVNGETYTKRSSTKAFPIAIVQTWRELADGDQPDSWRDRITVSFASSVDLAEREMSTRANWQSKYSDRNYRLELLATTVSAVDGAVHLYADCRDAEPGAAVTHIVDAATCSRCVNDRVTEER